MTSDSRINHPMANSPTDPDTATTFVPKYSPAVPISVYRELAAELQTAQAMVDSLKAQNQQLVRQNQQLRQEVEKVVQSAQHLQQIVASFGTGSPVEMPHSRPVIQPEPRHAASVGSQRTAASVAGREFPPPHQESDPEFYRYPETLVIEQEDARSRRQPHSEGTSDVNGWFLVVAILLIVLTAFGAGFLIVRPMLKNNSR
jgi:hypothetical protein